MQTAQFESIALVGDSEIQGSCDERFAPVTEAPWIAYWGGNGGSMAFVDLDRRMSFGYAQNRWIRGPHELDRCRVLLTAVYESLRRK